MNCPSFPPRRSISLRQPIESGEVRVSRANFRATYPARFQLVAAMNPCRCGHALDPGYTCKRAPNAKCIAQYQGRLSGPLLDRFDLAIEVPAVDLADLLLPAPGESSATVLQRVGRARAVQAARYASLGLAEVRTNAAAPAAMIEQIVPLEAEGTRLIHQAAQTLKLTARAFHRVLKVARTLADIAGEEKVARAHLAEALLLRARQTEW